METGYPRPCSPWLLPVLTSHFQVTRDSTKVAFGSKTLHGRGWGTGEA